MYRMNDEIVIRDKTFELFIPEREILKGIASVSEKIATDLKGKDPYFICVLNGAFMFASDLLKMMDFPCEIGFIRLKSYEGVKSAGTIKQIHGFAEDIENRNVVIIEDIIDTGHTMHYLLEQLRERRPASISIACLLHKPDAAVMPITPDYAAITIPNDFIVGYGLDYDGHGRNLRNIYKIKNGE
ncbi:MAG: hypoxanthine phosphoribosyltransferase [Dysgonamonadaceae bacterium]|nr:hypoxanthine phosphoribosyltransferase [Dysgonamonadaceae bacterium]